MSIEVFLKIIVLESFGQRRLPPEIKKINVYRSVFKNYCFGVIRPAALTSGNKKNQCL
jgi:hypothetical protein